MRILSKLIQALSRTNPQQTEQQIIEEQAQLFLDQPEERVKEQPHHFADNFRRHFYVPSDHAFLFKSYNRDTTSDPDKNQEYYDFIERDADGNFVARYLVLDADQFDRPSQSYRLYWKVRWK